MKLVVNVPALGDAISGPLSRRNGGAAFCVVTLWAILNVLILALTDREFIPLNDSERNPFLTETPVTVRFLDTRGENDERVRVREGTRGSAHSRGEEGIRDEGTGWAHGRGGKKRIQTMGPAGRTAAAKKRIQTMGPAGRTAATKKGNETR
jgi:hypothetical protein